MIAYRDLRTHSNAQAVAHVHGGLPPNQGVVITAWQAIEVFKHVTSDDQVLVTLPDFLNYARLLSTGQASSFARLPGSLLRFLGAGMVAGIAASVQPIKLAQQDFWLIAQCLLKYDLALLPAGRKPNVLLHSNLMDFAAFFNQRRFVEYFFQQARRRGLPPGVHTQQPGEVLSCLGRWDLIPAMLGVVAGAKDIDGMDALSAACGNLGLLSTSKVVIELDSWPADLQVINKDSEDYRMLTPSGVVITDSRLG